MESSWEAHRENPDVAAMHHPLCSDQQTCFLIRDVQCKQLMSLGERKQLKSLSNRDLYSPFSLMISQVTVTCFQTQQLLTVPLFYSSRGMKT